MKKVYILILIIAVGVVAIIFEPTYKSWFFKQESPIACTMEAKLCPDGSYVGRTGPNCEFSVCPSPKINENTTAKLNQKILNNGVYITPSEVVADSRCPIDVQCVWAGEVTIKVILEKGGSMEEVMLTQNKSLVFKGNTILLTDVTPENNSKNPISKEDYLFTFKVTPVITTTGQGTLKGTVTTSPTCPVERIPPDPGCAPRPYQTTINIRRSGENTIISSFKSDVLGKFQISLPAGSYDVEPVGGNVLPRCSSQTITLKANTITEINLSCDTGIR